MDGPYYVERNALPNDLIRTTTWSWHIVDRRINDTVAVCHQPDAAYLIADALNVTTGTVGCLKTK
jgi:hypothetical protein